MESKIVYIFVILSIIPLAYGLRCFRCSNEASCRNPSYAECTTAQATATASFLEYYFQNVRPVASSHFDCMRMNLTTPTTSNVFEGCVYSTMYSCGYPLRANFTSESLSKDCFQCNNANGCNPANRSYASVATLVMSLIFVLKYVMQ